MISIYFQWAPLQILRSSNRASFRVPSLPGYYLPGSKARKSTYRQSWLFKGDAIFFVFICFRTMGSHGKKYFIKKRSYKRNVSWKCGWIKRRMLLLAVLVDRFHRIFLPETVKVQIFWEGHKIWKKFST